MFYRVCDITTTITSAFFRMLGATRHAHLGQASSFHPFLPDCQLCCGRNKRPEFSAWLTEVKKVGLHMTVVICFSDKKVTGSTLAHRLQLSPSCTVKNFPGSYHCTPEWGLRARHETFGCAGELRGLALNLATTPCRHSVVDAPFSPLLVDAELSPCPLRPIA